MYQGEEIGMTDTKLPMRDALDPIAHKYKSVPRFIFDLAGETINRDEMRTPMQWDSSKNAGFSSAEKTWLPVHTNFSEVNVDKETSDENSLLKLVQQVLKIRKEMPAINSGTLELISKGEFPKGIFAYRRKHENEEVMVLLNFCKQKKEFVLSGDWKNIFSINKSDILMNGKICLDTYGAVILKK